MGEYGEKLRKLEELCRKLYPNDDIHGWGHIERVRKLCKILAREEKNVNYLVLEAAALLHDIERNAPNHAEASALKAKEILENLRFSEEFIGHVVEAIRTHSFSAGKRPESIEAKILSDADKIDALGAVGVFRAAAYGGLIGRGIDGLIKHAQEKLLNLENYILTRAGKRLAKRRQSFIAQYIEELLRELRELEL